MANDGDISAGLLGNPDIIIVGKKRLVENDQLRLGAIELKKDNKVDSLFKALSQAASYRAMANEVWIAAPGLREHEFQSAERHNSFMNQCRENRFGVLTLDLDENCKIVDGIHVMLRPLMLRPRENEIMNPSLQRKAINDLEWNYCHKCSRYYSGMNGVIDTGSGAENSIIDCGWLVDAQCARLLEEEMLRGTLSRAETLQANQ